MRIVFMGTPDFAVGSLQALCESGKHEILAVVTQPIIRRLPIAVLVRSSTHKSEPRLDFVRMVSVSSRLRSAVMSSRINWLSV